MIEMSRDEAIKRMRLMKYCEIEQSLTDHVTTACEQAISDMEKLQKIESLYGIDKFGKVLTREERDREVQKILESE